VRVARLRGVGGRAGQMAPMLSKRQHTNVVASG
jgi:hypothetical protein